MVRIKVHTPRTLPTRDAAAQPISCGRGFRQAQLACTSDCLGDLPEAFLHIQKAMKLDPISPSIERSFGIICDRIKATLSNSDRNPSDPTTPALYKMLVKVGRADEDAHLAMAAYLDHAGKLDEALRILEALTVVSPSFRGGWALKATVLRKLGRDQGA